MQIKAKLNHLRIAPRKAREVADLIRGKSVADARSQLSFTVKKTCLPVLKLLNSAVASAKNTYHLDEANLCIEKIFVDEGPSLKRWHPMSRGRGYQILKRTCHITIILGEKIPIKTEKTEKAEIKEEEIKKVKVKKVAKKKTAKK